MARAETMLAIAEATGMNLEVLAFIARRFEQRLNVLDTAESGRRAELEQLVADDFAELAKAY